MTISGLRTSLRLEEEIWGCLDEICQREGLTLSELCTIIDDRRHEYSRTSAVRVFVLTYYRAAATVAGHTQAGHGFLAEQAKKSDKKSNKRGTAHRR